jgi:hypothetical protein
LLLLATAACAHDVLVRYPVPEGAEAPRAVLELRFTDTVYDANVSVNGKLVVEGVRTTKVVIEDLPAGPTQVVVASSGAPMERAFQVELPPGGRVVVPLVAPAGGSGGAGTIFLQALASVFVYGVYAALHSLF